MAEATQAQQEYTLGQTIYAIDNSGSYREWKIDVEDLGTYAEIHITSGTEGGQHVETRIPVFNGKNIGKSNETTYYEQAVKDAFSAAELKLRDKYRINKEDAIQGELRSGVPQPMLAHTYDPIGICKNGKTIKQLKYAENEVIFIQPKYDGNRCMVKITPDGCQFFTRKGDPQPVDLPHIEKELFARYTEMGMTEDIILDGEVFSDEISFSKLNGLLNRKKALSPEQRAIADATYFVLFDVMMQEDYKLRYAYIRPFESGKIVQIIESVEIEFTLENIQPYHQKWVARGDEGTIGRRLGVPYQHKRTNDLFKYKDWIESEFEILDIIADKRGGGLVAGFRMKMDTPALDSDGKLVEDFGVGNSGLSQEMQREISANLDEYIGKQATIKYQMAPGDPRPRFGKFKAMRYDL